MVEAAVNTPVTTPKEPTTGKRGNKKSNVDSPSLSSKPKPPPLTRVGSATRLTASALKALGNETLGPFKVPPTTDNKAKKEKDKFQRMITVHTIGVETATVTDKDGHTRRVISKHHQHSLKPNCNGGSLPSGGNDSASMTYESVNSSIASNISFSQAHPKLVSEVAPVLSIEKIFGITPEPTTTVVTPSKKYVPEHLWVTRYMKNSNRSLPDKKVAPQLEESSDEDFFSYMSHGTGVSYSRSLILRARVDLAASLATAPKDHSTAEKDAALARANGMVDDKAKTKGIAPSIPKHPARRRKESQWQHISKDPLGAAAEHKVREDAKQDVLHTFDKLMKGERSSTSYAEGRRKNISQSEYRFNRDVDKLDSVDEISSLTMVNQASKDLLLWKKFCSERVVSVNKGQELKQIPIKSKTGFHTIYWGKLMIEKSNTT